MIALTNFLYGLTKVFATIILAVMMLLTFADVTLRYLFSDPILGSNEMTQFLLGGAVFCGLVLVSGQRSHIVVTLFEPVLLRVAPAFYKWLGILTNVVGILAVTFFVIRYSLFMYEQGNVTEIREWPWWQLGAVLGTLSVFASLLAVRAIWAPIPEQSDRPSDYD